MIMEKKKVKEDKNKINLFLIKRGQKISLLLGQYFTP